MLVSHSPPTKKRKTKRREDKSEVVIKSREFIDDEDDAIDQRTSGPSVPLLDLPVASSSIPKSPRQPSPSQLSSHRHPRSASPDPIPLTKRKRKAEDGNAGSARVRRRIIPIEGNLQDVGQLPVYTNPSTSNIESDKAGSEREQLKDGNLRNEEVKTKPKKKAKGKANGKNTRANQESTNASTPQDEGGKVEEEATGLQKPPAATRTKNRKRTKGDDAFEHLTPHGGINPNSATHGENTGSEPSGEDASAHLKPKSQTPVDKPKASPVPLSLKVARPAPKVDPIVSKPRETLTVADILRLMPQTGGGLHRVGLSKRERLAPLHARLRTPPPPPPRLPKPPKKKGKDEDEEDSEEDSDCKKREEKRKAAWYSP
ncbi:hypothetical protein BS47DRAFT_1342960 [Hydnum rufescens UP504]|uniref:Uncharacterized protein n=1 Tax=Hydnum rufescens UP504 TaxID=1448309 RepID=A0A9P6DY77_9AGAM|nr:hypothetical protein BS47DRAFT_1342960 [Hydnum rufescens UP504]